MYAKANPSTHHGPTENGGVGLVDRGDWHAADYPQPTNGVKSLDPYVACNMGDMGRNKAAGTLTNHADSPLAVNLRMLVKREAEGSVHRWVQHHKSLAQSTINRICNGTADSSISYLQKIAEATHHAPWQLLHPEFDPRRMPPLADPRAMRVAAIFATIDSEVDRRRVEAIIEQFAPEPSVAPAAESTLQPAKTRRR